ncbi:MAG: sialidase family protein [bacterium]|nr:sialidase family protein [bacterium]
MKNWIVAGCLAFGGLSLVAAPYQTYLDVKGPGSCGAVMFEGRDGAIVCGIKGWYRQSVDGGRTWKKAYPFTKGASTNLLRLKDGRLLSIGGETCENIRTNSLKACNFYAYFSSDEGRTWNVQGRVPLSTDNRRLYLMNDRVMRLSTGRILVSFSLHPNELLDKKLESVGWVNAFYSDDEGRTWHEGKRRPTSAADQLCEPNVFEKKDGSLVMLARTGKGYLYRCDSTDGGENWSVEHPTTLRSPCAPFYMKKDPFTGWTFIAWDNSFPAHIHQYPRSPLSLAVTRDEGETWEFIGDIEDDPMSSYGYPSIHFTKQSILVTYYEEIGCRTFNAKEQRCKLTILDRDELTVDRVEKIPLK